MYRFASNRRKQDLIIHYKQVLMTPSTLHKKERSFAAIVNKYACLGFLNGVTVESILTYEIHDLVVLFYSYVVSVGGNSKKEKINKALSKVFNYDSYKGKITNFLLEDANKYKLSTCPYCDIFPLYLYDPSPNGGSNHDFEVDHYLDKGDCPIVALSLFNFVASCHSCNHTKSTTIFGTNANETERLAPMSTQYDFVHNVRFVLTRPDGNITAIRTYKEAGDIRIKLKFDDPIYKYETDALNIENRYNSESLKQQIYDYIVDVNRCTGRFKMLWNKIFRKDGIVEKTLHLPDKSANASGCRVQYDKLKRDILDTVK